MIPVILILTILVNNLPAYGETIEKIFAVVNGELITYSELKGAEAEFTRALTQQYEGEELEKQIADMKKNLLDSLINQKVILSFARDKNYDVDGEVDLTIKNLKKQNNITSDDDLKRALAQQGMDYDNWKKQLGENIMQRRYIGEMIGQKINDSIDNSDIMAYYKSNIKEYTIPAKNKLNCIFLDKTQFITPESLEEKKQTIDDQLKSHDFITVAKVYSMLPGAENSYYLGEFKVGELDPAIEKAASTLKPNEYSGWVETESGWYLIQLVEHEESKLVEYQKVRDDIEIKLKMELQEKEVAILVEQLKKDSHIKIYHKF